MAFIQRTTPPPNKQLTFAVSTMTTGMNNRSTQLTPEESSISWNMDFYDAITMEKRYGSKKKDAVQSSGKLTFLSEYRPYATSDVFVRATDTLATFSDGATASLSGRMDGVNFLGKFFFVDGVKFRVKGVFPQVGSTYEKIVGTASTSITTFNVVTPPGAFTPLGTTHTRGVTVYDYANQQIWYEPCENELNDPYKGANVMPTNIKYIEVLKGRMYLSGSNKDNDNVYITDAGNPYYTPVALPLQLPPNSDQVVGLAVYDDAVIVGRNEDIHVIIGQTNNPELGLSMFELRKLNTHTGFANNQAVNIVQNYLFFVGSDGNAYALSASRQDEKNLSTIILNQKVDFSLKPFDLTLTDFKTACSAYCDDKWYVSIGQFVFVYSYLHKAWTVFDSLHITSFYVRDGKLTWGNKNGNLMEWDETTHLDDGIPFRGEWTSGWNGLGDESTYKQFREFYISAHTFDAYDSDVQVKFEIDYMDVNDRFLVRNMISRFGTSRFGDRFISRTINFSAPFILGRRGRLLRFTFQNGYFYKGTVSTPADLVNVGYVANNDMYYVTSDGLFHVFDDNAWMTFTREELNQPMRIYNITGTYELRGRR